MASSYPAIVCQALWEPMRTASLQSHIQYLPPRPVSISFPRSFLVQLMHLCSPCPLLLHMLGTTLPSQRQQAIRDRSGCGPRRGLRGLFGGRISFEAAFLLALRHAFGASLGVRPLLRVVVFLVCSMLLGSCLSKKESPTAKACGVKLHAKTLCKYSKIGTFQVSIRKYQSM